jgi:hypothetical protein
LTEHSDVASLLDTAVALEASLAAAVPDTEPARVARRLRDSVIRPLRLTVGTSASASTDRPGDTVDGGALDDQVWALACSATSLRVTLPSNAGDEQQITGKHGDVDPAWPSCTCGRDRRREQIRLVDAAIEPAARGG